MSAVEKARKLANAPAGKVVDLLRVYVAKRMTGFSSAEFAHYFEMFRDRLVSLVERKQAAIRLKLGMSDPASLTEKVESFQDLSMVPTRDLRKDVPSYAIPAEITGEKKRERHNLEAMRLVTSKSPSGMTDEDKTVLAAYSGWGGLSIAKNDDEMEKILPAGFRPEKRGLIHEYYTPPHLAEDLARFMSTIINDLYEKHGEPLVCLEPAAGVGRFIRAFRDEDSGLPDQSWTAVEYSKVSASILQGLGIADHAVHSSFERWADTNEDLYRKNVHLVVSNPPYGKRGVSIKEDTDAISTEERRRAYAYFLRRGLDFLAPGGIGVMLIPAGFMTGDVNGVAGTLRRRVLSEYHVLGAFRLPSKLFPGANLVTDLIIFRSRGGQVTGSLKGIDDTVVSGKYFEHYPERILGIEENSSKAGETEEHKAKGRWAYKIHFANADFYDVGDKIYKEDGSFRVAKKQTYLGGSFDGFPPSFNTHTMESYDLIDPKKRKKTSSSTGLGKRKLTDKQRAQQKGSFDDHIYQAAELGVRYNRYFAQVAVDDPEAEDSWLELKEAFESWIDIQGEEGRPRNPWGDPSLTVALKKNKRKDDLQTFLSAFESNGMFVKSFSDKPVIQKAFSLNPNDVVSQADELFRRRQELTVVELFNYHVDIGGPYDTMALFRRGALPILYKAGWAHDGNSWDELVPSDSYYVGDLNPKLFRARDAAKKGLVNAVEQRDKLVEIIGWEDIGDIDMNPSHGWLPIDVIEQFVNEKIIDVIDEKYPGDNQPKKLYKDEDGLIKIEGVDYLEMKSLAKVKDKINRETRDFVGYLNHDKQRFSPYQPEVRILVGDEWKWVPENIEIVKKRKMAEWEPMFESFVKQDVAISEKVEKVYNSLFKGFIHPTFSGEPLSVARWKSKDKGGRDLYPYQAQAARRVIKNRGGLIAFDVGLGKTYTGLAVLARARQEGWAKRPVILVPKHITWKWYKDIRTVLPDYRIGVIGSEKYTNRKGEVISRLESKEERSAKWRKFQRGEFDVVILTYESLALTRVDEEHLNDYVERTSAIKKNIAIAQAEARKKKESDPNKALSEREEAILEEGVGAFVAEKLELGGKRKYDPGIQWDELGIDFLMVDEAQNFKNLYMPQAGTGNKVPMYMGSEGKGSKRAWQLDFRCELTRRQAERRPGGSRGNGIVLLSATPAKNSPLEFYNLIQYIDHEVWARRGIVDPQQFVSRYCDFRTDLTVSTTEQKVVSREMLVGFKNLHELRDVIFRYGEFKNADSPEVKSIIVVPKAKVYRHEVEMDDVQAEEYVRLRADMEEAIEESKKKMAMSGGQGDNSMKGRILQIMSMMSLVSLHPLLVDSRLKSDDDLSTNEDGKKKKRSLSSKEVVKKASAIPMVEQRSEKLDQCARVISQCRENRPDCGHIIFVENVAVHVWMKNILAAGITVEYAPDPSKPNITRPYKCIKVPPERIAILNSVEAKGDLQRQEIAEHFNGDSAEGVKPKYDIVIANKIAYEGVDLQKRTCAIHHLDLPWEPATLQQRNGRGVRQGNDIVKDGEGEINFVGLHYYITGGTMDGSRFQAIRLKAGWMSGLIEGEKRNTNNPAADSDADETNWLVLTAANPEEAREAIEKRKKIFLEQQRAVELAALLKDFREAENAFRAMERIVNPKALERKRKAAESYVERMNRRVSTNPGLWSFYDIAVSKVRDQPVVIVGGEEPNTQIYPVWEGLRIASDEGTLYEIGVIHSYGTMKDSVGLRYYEGSVGVDKIRHQSFESVDYNKFEDFVKSEIESRHYDPEQWPEYDWALYEKENLSDSARYRTLALACIGQYTPRWLVKKVWARYSDQLTKVLGDDDWRGPFTWQSKRYVPIWWRNKHKKKDFFLTTLDNASKGDSYEIIPPTKEGFELFKKYFGIDGKRDGRLSRAQAQDIVSMWWGYGFILPYGLRNKDKKKNPLVLAGNPVGSYGAEDIVTGRADDRAFDLEDLSPGNDSSYKAAKNAVKRRYGDPDIAVEVDLPNEISEYLAAVGELVRVEYLAADGRGKKVFQWYHDMGDQGEDKEPTSPPILAWDAKGKFFVIAPQKGSKPRFTYRGIMG